ncbi:MAG: aminopeptidase, partial [Verrucomicrobia bacterium]|nr:aminopeptidase [Verrucomicrobiota bacterium]
GYDKIVCYWGVLESEHQDKVTKAVSWVPLAGYLVPDQRDSMRIRLKAVVMDVASGQWTFVSPPPILSSSFSSVVSRRNTDQDLVRTLKEAGYRGLASALIPGSPY